jgi:leucyl-tRNA synthetase
MILGEDNQKMSKSRGNIINPDDILRDYGADSFRMYEMFMGPLEVSKPWMTAGLVGVCRFLERIWALSERPIVNVAPDAEASGGEHMLKLLHKTVKKVSEDTASLNFNTAISAMMIYSNELAKLKEIPLLLWGPFVQILSVYAPHLGEELWEKLGAKESVSKSAWPNWDESLCVEKEVTVMVQVNGKIRDKFNTAAGTSKEDLEKTALGLSGVRKWTKGKKPEKIIVVPDKLVNVVVK